jgi:hypothetical protein
MAKSDLFFKELAVECRSRMSMDRTFQVLNRMVQDGVISRYAIAGAVGALAYLEPMTTRDVDILVSVADLGPAKSGLLTLEPIFAYLRQAGYAEFEDEGVVIEGWPVQFLLVASVLDAEGLDQAIEENVEGVKVHVLRPEHLVAAALKVGRLKDHLRIQAFLESGELEPSALAGVLGRHQLGKAWKDYCQRYGITDSMWVDLRS